MGCSVRRFLPPGEKLYRGYTLKVDKSKNVKTSARSLKSQLKVAIKPKPNKFLFGQPYKVWLYYKIGKPESEKGFRAWLRNRLGEPPVLGSRINAAATAVNMQSLMENLGYFHSTVSGDTTITKGYFVKANYHAFILPQYMIKDITWVKDTFELFPLLANEFSKSEILKKNKPYRLSDIQAERDRVDVEIKKKGYYFFNSNYIMAYADSTIGNNQVNLFFSIKTSTPVSAQYPYKINRITLFPNYSLVYPPPDTSKTGTENFDGLLIRDTVKKFKPKLFKHIITYRPGQLYSSVDQNTSLNRLINLGTFKFVKNRYEQVKDSADPYRLNVYYYLTPAKRKAIQGELDGFSKENKYIGSKISVNWKNRNAFRGAEQLNIKASAGFEASLMPELKKNNNLTLGGEASVVVPRFFIPFFNIKESNLFLPKTRLLIAYELLRKQLFYTKNIFHLQYEFNWKESSNKEHTLAPFSLSYLLATNVTDSFYKEALVNPSVLLNVYSEAILGSFYSYTYNTLNPVAKNQWYFTGSLDISGNIAGLITGAKSYREKKIFGTPFAQYVKTDFDIRYARKLTKNLTLANRLQVGIGIPYNNSALLPITKQYTIGGASSIRGFASRTIGPGSYLPTIEDQRFFQIIGGDFKFLANSELRFPIAGKLNGAVFADIGNIWTKDTLLFGVAGQLKKDSYKELALAAGIGLRFDATVLLIRFDLGIPLRKPYLPDGQRWVINKINFGDRDWRRNNLILNIAIGYPF